MNTPTFLEEIAQHLIEKYQMNFEHTVVVLPNKRAQLFLQEAIKTHAEKYVIAPKIISIEEFIAHLAQIKKIDPLETLLEFYGVYMQITPKNNQQDFETFSGWAKMLLQDFNEIDTYLLEPSHVFSYLKNIDDINHWAVDSSQRTEMIDNYLNFWDVMPIYYKELYAHFISQNKGYQGIVYREAVKNLQAFITNDEKSVKYYFCGFNALNRAEEVIFQELLRVDKAHVFWNIDAYFLEDTEHDAGYFARKIKKSWSYYNSYPFEKITNVFSEKKNIEIIATPKAVGQARIVGELIEKLSHENHNLQNTALVLGDETLLQPVINSLPESADAINITMGFSSKTHPATVLFYKLLKMHSNASTRNTGSVFYYKEILEILTHPLLTEVKKAQKIVDHIHINNTTFISWKHISKLLNDSDGLLQDILNPWGELHSDEIILRMLKIIDFIKDNFVKNNDRVSVAFLYTIYKTLKKIQTYVSKYDYIQNINQLSAIYKQIMDLMEVSFEGEPLDGLQIMGILESRVLDFETVIITSVNEGKFPSGKFSNSFIPYDVKLELGLPTFKEKDAIFSYHFYHLIHRAKNIYIVYNSDQDGRDVAERSRYITQMLLQHPNNHTITEKSYFAKLPNESSDLKRIFKSENLLVRLKDIATNRGFSPSSIGNYLRNPMQFYFQRVLGIREVEEVEENIALNTLGTIVHNTLEDLYQPFMHQVLQEETILQMITNVPDRLDYHFKEVYSKTNDRLGKNLLAMEVARQNVLHFLNEELREIKKGVQIQILSLEEDLETVIIDERLPYPVKIAGKADRVESRNGIIRIIDYKTGNVQKKDVRIGNFEDLLDGITYEKVIQLLCYAIMSYDKYKEHPMEVGLYSFKNKKEGFLMFDWDKKGSLITPEVIDEFRKQLVNLLAEILSAENYFEEKVN